MAFAAEAWDQHADNVLRVPPQSTEAEQSVLGGLMLAAISWGDAAMRAWDEVADLITWQDFYRRDHQLIWRAIEELHKRQSPFDAVTVGEWFVSQGLGEQVAGGAYLVELASTTPSAANIRAYAAIVKNKSQLRRIIEVGTDMVNAAFEPKGSDSLDIIGKAQTHVAALMQDVPCELEEMQPIMQRVFEGLLARRESGGGIAGKSMGLRDLENQLNGLKPGLYILAARPKQGKTTLAQNLAEHFALVRREPVAIFSFEMRPDELGDRMLSSVGHIEGERIRRGDLDDVDWTNCTTAMRKLRAAPLHVSRPANATVQHVCAQARRLHAKTPLGLIVIDYLQLMDAPGDNRAQGLAEITRALKLLSNEIEVPILLLSQLNRKLEDRPNKRPIPSDLRDSGAIEQDADAVIFIYRDDWYHPQSPDRGTVEVNVALQRNGAPGMVRLLYTPSQYRFEDLPDDWQPAPLPEKPAKKKAFSNKPDHAAKAAGDDA